MALLGKIAPGDIAIGINALQEAILACQEFEMSKSVTIDSYKYVNNFQSLILVLIKIFSQNESLLCAMVDESLFFVQIVSS